MTSRADFPTKSAGVALAATATAANVDARSGLAGGLGDLASGWERATSGGRNASLIDLPFDQYNRHTLVARAVDAVRGEPRRPLSILDVGGYPCWTPRFLPHDTVTVVDVQGGPDTCERFVLADGSALPFRDDAFDVVVSLDSLEHVPRPRRAAFLRELARVARDYVLITAPFGTPEVRLAEDLLYEFIRATLKARHDQLTEHREFALPEVAEVEQQLDELGLRFARLPSGNLYNWLAMMLAKHYLMALPETESLHTALDRFYNSLFFAADQREPAYRQLFLIAVGGDPVPLRAFVEAQRAPEEEPAAGLRRLELAQLLIKLLDLRLMNHEDPRLREQIAARDRQIEDLSAGVAELRAMVAERDRAIAELQAAVVSQGGEIERLRIEGRGLRQRLVDTREAAAEMVAKAQRELDEARIEAERYRIMLAARERDVEKLNEHIERIANGRVMRTLNSVKRTFGAE